MAASGANARAHAPNSRLAARPSRHDDIWDYIARHSIPNADRFVDRIERRFALLADNPGLGVTREDLRPGLRCFTHARHLIYYRAIRSGIEVVRVVHGARKQETLFRE